MTSNDAVLKKDSQKLEIRKHRLLVSYHEAAVELSRINAEIAKNDIKLVQVGMPPMCW